jgi:hypothetical protein
VRPRRGGRGQLHRPGHRDRERDRLGVEFGVARRPRSGLADGGRPRRGGSGDDGPGGGRARRAARDGPVGCPPANQAPATQAPTSASGCHPLTNGGNCYEPGEYCRKADHGASGVAGDGRAISCEDNNGWRWEAA